MTDEEKEKNKREFDLLLENLKSDDNSYNYANTRFDYIIVALSVGGISLCYTSITMENKNFLTIIFHLFLVSQCFQWFQRIKKILNLRL